MPAVTRLSRSQQDIAGTTCTIDSHQAGADDDDIEFELLCHVLGIFPILTDLPGQLRNAEDSISSERVSLNCATAETMCSTARLLVRRRELSDSTRRLHRRDRDALEVGSAIEHPLHRYDAPLIIPAQCVFP